MKKALAVICATLFSFVSTTGFAQAGRFIPELELTGGIGFRFGQIASVTPQISFLTDIGKGFSCGPGIGIRGGIITVDYQIPDKIRHTQEELDLTLYYRFRYAPGVFCAVLDAGGAFGLYSYDKRTIPSECRYSGFFVEPQVGACFNRWSLALGVLLNQTDYTQHERKGDMVFSTTTKDKLTPALTLHVGYAL
ncbi:MAG: hypothetical protein IKR82_00685 [Bacteroidales bacterium]|nr:hypothetical protein [Bacteroidales bacterium]